MTTRVIAKEELPYGKIAHRFEGYRYADYKAERSPVAGGGV